MLKFPSTLTGDRKASAGCGSPRRMRCQQRSPWTAQSSCVGGPCVSRKRDLCKSTSARWQRQGPSALAAAAAAAMHRLMEAALVEAALRIEETSVVPALAEVQLELAVARVEAVQDVLGLDSTLAPLADMEAVVDLAAAAVLSAALALVQVQV